jgi:superfamily I DNA/RNA helicase
VERARHLFKEQPLTKGVAFLSFTNAAISELDKRLQEEGLVLSSPYPNFIGTFDGFIWQFLVAPFGMPGFTGVPRLVPDLQNKKLIPFPTAQPIPLSCFRRGSGVAIPSEINREGYTGQSLARYEAAARQMMEQHRLRGEIDFEDARAIALDRLQSVTASQQLSVALSARFREIIVDEAQDCNPMDLMIIDWLRISCIPVKIICDPNQAIYGFRGGVGTELLAFRDTFQPDERLGMSGNFRSSNHIAKAIVALRPQSERAVVDEAVGIHRDESTAVHILGYKGTSVPTCVGIRFRELVVGAGLDPRDCPVVSSTLRSASSAIGLSYQNTGSNLTLRLAAASMKYNTASEIWDKVAALDECHEIILNIGENLDGHTYRQYLIQNDLGAGSWRPGVIGILEKLQYGVRDAMNPTAWLRIARNVLSPYLAQNGRTIGQRLPNHTDLASILTAPSILGLHARTIHSVKGLEFPGICVVISTRTAGGILDFLSTGSPADNAESARKVYVGASRAMRLLVMAFPKTRASVFATHLRSMGGDVNLEVL